MGSRWVKWPPHRVHVMLRLAFLVVLLGAFYLGATTHAAHVNTNLATKDQDAYLRLSRQLAEGQLVNDGARGPLSFLLISLAWAPAMTQAQYFASAKHLMIWVSMGAMLIFAASAYKTLSARVADVVLATIAIPVACFYSAYVKAEGPFYFILGAATLVLFRTVQRPKPLTGAVAGALLGLAQLLKASAAPMLLVYLGAAALAMLLRSGRHRTRTLAAAACCVSAFVVLTATSYADNERRFGSSGYNVNTSFYVYYDSWGEVVKGTRSAGDRSAYPDLPPEKIPTAAKYFAQDPIGRTLRRLSKGVEGNLKNSFEAWGFARYVAISVGFVAASALFFRRSHKAWRLTVPLYALFGASVLGLGIPALWFYSVHPGLRFVLAAGVVVVCGAAYLADTAFRQARTSAVTWALSYSPRGLLVGALGMSLLYDVPVIVLWAAYRFPQAGW